MPGWHKTSRHERGYGSTWVKLRKAALIRDAYLCQPCLRQGRPTPATEVDHITPKAKQGTDDLGNLQSICADCHRDKTLKERGARDRARSFDENGFPIWDDEPRPKQYSIPFNLKPSRIPVKLVCGPPGSGKTTYVRANAGPDDLVIDLDDLKEKVGGVKWDTSGDIWRAAFRERDRLIKSLATSDAPRAWLIVTAPTKAERHAWRDALGRVTIKVMGTPEQECIERIKRDPARRQAADSQIKAVKAWWRQNER